MTYKCCTLHYVTDMRYLTLDFLYLFLQEYKDHDPLPHKTDLEVFLCSINDKEFQPTMKDYLNTYVRLNTGVSNIRPAGWIRPARLFYAARRHLQKYKLPPRIKPKTFYFFIEHLRTSRPFLLFTAGAYLGGGHCSMPPLLF